MENRKAAETPRAGPDHRSPSFAAARRRRCGLREESTSASHTALHIIRKTAREERTGAVLQNEVRDALLDRGHVQLLLDALELGLRAGLQRICCHL